MGLAIYLDNKEIDIFDPISNETFISGVYQKPYWIIELHVDKNDELDKNILNCVNKSIFANSSENQMIRYFTRSVAAKEAEKKIKS